MNQLEVSDQNGSRILDRILFTQLGSNISTPTAEYLACLAIQSVAKADIGNDGISYLIGIKINRYDGIVTRLSKKYEEEILEVTSSCCLRQALEKAREQIEKIEKIKADDLDELLNINVLKDNRNVPITPSPDNISSAKDKLMEIFKNLAKYSANLNFIQDSSSIMA